MQDRYTTNELMMDHDVNKSATLRFNLIEGGGGGSVMHTFVVWLDKTLQESHEVTREK